MSLQTRLGSHFCGGTIIGKLYHRNFLSVHFFYRFTILYLDLRHVLSAAHCITSPFGVVMNPNEVN